MYIYFKDLSKLSRKMIQILIQKVLRTRLRFLSKINAFSLDGLWVSGLQAFNEDETLDGPLMNVNVDINEV